MTKTIFSILTYLLLAMTLNAEHWSTGFYRETGSEDVYFYNDEYRYYCFIQNHSQLENYSAVDQVRVVGDVESILNLGKCLYECPWHDGFYKSSDNDAIYRLYPGNICLVSTPQMLAAYGAIGSVVTTGIIQGRGGIRAIKASYSQSTATKVGPIDFSS